MPRSKTQLVTFNRGLVSPLGIARVDLERTAMSAETMNNWMPRNLGSMMLRPGTGYIGNTASDNKARIIPFVFAADDTALIELTDSVMRVWVDDALISRPTVSTTISKGDFSSPQTGWVDNSEVGGSVTYTAVSGVDVVRLLGDGANAGIVTQDVTVAAGDQNVEHGLLVEVSQLDPTAAGYISGVKPRLRAGLGTWSASAVDDLISDVQLDTGNHHFSFTPSGDFWVELSNREDGRAYVQTCDMDASGTLSIAALWAEADLPSIRYEQSGDIIYLACKDVPPIKISRYTSDSKSWGVGLYETQDGPFDGINISPITIAPNALSGGVNLVASAPFWETTDVGRLVRIDSDGQLVTASTVGADDTWTNPIRVTGVTNARIFTITITGTWTTTASLQRSLTDPDISAVWVEVATFTANTAETYDDTLDNQVAWYRIGFDTGWDSGTADFRLDYPNGSITGIARIYFYSSVTVAQAEVLQDFGSTSAQKNWYLGSWSTRTGFPTTVAFTEGRLGWASKNKVHLSVSDAYESFDNETIGDSGPITRTIASGSVDAVNWMLGLRRLLMGTATREHVMRSSSEDEPLTPTNALLKDYGTQGSANVIGLKLDNAGLYVQRGGIRLMETAFGGNFDYETSDLTTFNPEIGSPGITHIALQRQPDSRVHCVRSDGTVAILLHDPAENITCWVELTVPGTSAAVEDVVVLPGADGSGEDAVYYVVKRTVNAATVRFLERWSLESENQGGTLNKQVDAHITGTVTGGVLTGLTHLEGEEVAVWVNGVDAGTYTVSSGQITSVTSDGSAVAGLSYTAQFKSAKLGELLEKRNLSRLGVILYNTHYQGLKYGDAFDNLDDLPLVKDGTTTADDTIHAGYDEENFSFDGVWDTDARLCLQAESPRPCTLLAAIVVTED